MTAKITREILEGYLNCRYKGHLKLAGEHGTRSDYEALLIEQRDEVNGGRAGGSWAPPQDAWRACLRLRRKSTHPATRCWTRL